MAPARITRNSESTLEPSHVEDFDDILESMSEDGRKIITFMENRFDSLERRFTEMLSAKNKEISALQDKVNSLTTEVDKLRSLMDDSDAYERKDTIIISGNALPVFVQGENCSLIARNLMAEKLRTVIGENDVNTAHRLGEVPTNLQQDRRSIIMKLCRRDMKQSIIQASSKMRCPGLFVNESLTPTRRTIFKTLRDIKRNHPALVKGCSTFEGKVYAYTKASGTSPTSGRDVRHLVNTQEQLRKFCVDHVKKPLSAFLQTWPH